MEITPGLVWYNNQHIKAQQIEFQNDGKDCQWTGRREESVLIVQFYHFLDNN